MRSLRQFSRLVLLMCMAAAALSAQEERTLFATHLAFANGGGAAGSALSSSPYTFRSNVDEVEIRFVATDSAGRPFPKLEAHQVQVFADGKPVTDIKSFGPSRTTPISLGILLDLSESVRPEMHAQVVTISNALAEVLEPSRDHEFVVAFSNKIKLVQPPTSDFAQVKHVLESSSGDHSLTSLYDAIVRTCRDQFGDAPQSPAQERRVLLVFTDGIDNLSIHSLGDAIEAANRAGVVINAVAPRAGDLEGQNVLRELTEHTGGTLELFRPSKKPDTAVASSIRALSASEYALTFHPVDGRPGMHPIELHAAESSVLLRSEKAYYLSESH